MNINDDKKISVLTNMLNERYKAEHNMRDRSVNFTKWILGLGIALLWILLTKVELENFTRIYSLIFIFSYSVLSLWFLSEICKGFKNNRNIIIKLEDAIHLYDKEYYIKDETILPEEYKDSSQKKIPSHFLSLYGLLIVLSIFLFCIVIYKPSINKIENPQPINNKESLEKK